MRKRQLLKDQLELENISVPKRARARIELQKLTNCNTVAQVPGLRSGTSLAVSENTQSAKPILQTRLKQKIEYELKCGPVSRPDFEQKQEKGTKEQYVVCLLRKARALNVPINRNKLIFLLKNPNKINPKMILFLETWVERRK